MSSKQGNDLNSIRAIVMDVDGVLTDGMVILGSGGTELKSFNVRDGMAITMARRCGMKIGFITSRTSEAVQRRGEELNIDFLLQGVGDKLARLGEISASENIPLGSICYIGDDIIDIPIFKRVGFAATVQDAPDEVKSCVSYVSQKEGGRGAVRDIIQHILVRQGRWEETVNSMIHDWEKETVE